MRASTPPEAVAVEVIAAQATEADSQMLAQLAAGSDKALPGVAYVVRVQLKTVPEATSQGWALYVDDLRIPKYWEYDKGIYFKVFDPQFLDDHKGAKLRFSQNGTEFTDTGLKLAPPKASAKKRTTTPAQLPRQQDLLH
jgi:hypothetical protein